MSVCWITCIVILPTLRCNNLHGEKSQEKSGALFKLTLRQWISGGDDLALSDSRHKWAFYHCQVPQVFNHEQWLLPFLYFVICFPSHHVWQLANTSLVDMAMIALWLISNCNPPDMWTLPHRIEVVGQRSRREWLAKKNEFAAQWSRHQKPVHCC